MPIENERKIVLQLGLENDIPYIADKKFNIQQGYLLKNGGGLSVRIRQSTLDDKTKRYLTVKQKIDKRIVEIEKKIDIKDYEMLASLAVCWVNKIRYLVNDWEIDFFKRGEETYFAMAEIELPEDVEEPEFIPYFIQDYLLYIVPQNDCRFSSKKLANYDYTRKLIEELVFINV